MTSNDPLHELIRQGARDLIARAVETELEGLLSQYADIKTADGRQAVVRNGYLPKRTIQTGVGDVEVQVPKVRDRSGAGIRFNSHLLPPYLKRARSMDELIPWLYLRGISSGDFQEALSALVGEQAKGLSANTVSRLKAQWLDEHKDWQRRDLSQTRGNDGRPDAGRRPRPRQDLAKDERQALRQHHVEDENRGCRSHT